MKTFFSLLLTASCAWGFADGFAPIDYTPMEEAAPEPRLLTFADDKLEEDLIAEKEWYPIGSTPEGAAPESVPSSNNATTPNTGGKGIFPEDPSENAPYYPEPELPTPQPQQTPQTKPIPVEPTQNP